MMPRWLVLVVVALLLFTSTSAKADAINGPPENCAPGSVGVSSHQGEWCEPRPCQSDADCKGIWTERDRVDGKCESTSLCVGNRKVYPHHRVRSDAGPRDQPVALKTCGRMESCGAEAVCETANRCVVPSKKITVESAKRGCGCGKTSGSAKSSVFLGALMAGWLLRRRGA